MKRLGRILVPAVLCALMFLGLSASVAQADGGRILGSASASLIPGMLPEDPGLNADLLPEDPGLE